ncbi:hypothetical protein [Ciceribacter sp. RN22]|uniref:hypothetical protein n=1 Tax=Ciceribacter sp. RN22 TaxID=2954932 RepID=UPI002093AC9D|nr:hypothetical protein [Ciceribacter sp. RN22]MCO6178435.1 hypothetical protein [Ciceribacter sp. RN22]
MQDIVTRIASIPFMDIGIYYFVAEAACIVAFLYRRRIFYVYWYFIFGILLPPTTIILYAYFYLGFTAFNHSWSHIALLQFLSTVSTGWIGWTLFQMYRPEGTGEPVKAILAALLMIFGGIAYDYYTNIPYPNECVSIKCRSLSYIFGDGRHISVITYISLVWTSFGLMAIEAMIFRSLNKH